MKDRRNSRTAKLFLSGVCIAILAVLAQISIPMPAGVPLSLQTFAVALCGYVLGWKYGLLSVIGYLLLGAVGVPVFTGLKGGIGILFGFTGGFLVGFLPLVACCGVSIMNGAKGKNGLFSISMGVLGVLLCHILGVIWFVKISTNPFVTAFMTVSLPYLLKDVLSIVGAYFLAGVIKKALQAGNTGLG